VEQTHFPRTSMDQRRARLFKRVGQWEKKDVLDKPLSEWRWKCVGMNPIYRDLIVFVMWAREASYDVHKEVMYDEEKHSKSRSVDLRTMWF